jgi:hypothetical protein
LALLLTCSTALGGWHYGAPGYSPHYNHPGHNNHYNYPQVYVQPYYRPYYPPVYVQPYPNIQVSPYVYYPNGMVYMWINGNLIRIR